MPVSALLKLVSRRPARTHCVPHGVRAYAVGDIHGRLDLLDRLLDDIAADDERRPAAATQLVFLGDLIDRGPDSAGVVERLLGFSKRRAPVRFLMGNHEEVFLRVLAGDVRAMRFLLRIGGRATVMSYGFEAEEYASLDFESLTARLIERVPAEHVAFLGSFEEMIELGDYLFVHAGIRPGIDLASQQAADLRWIRDDFLDCRDDHGKLGSTATASPTRSTSAPTGSASTRAPSRAEG